MRLKIAYIILPLFLLAAACDSGDIYPEENKNFVDVKVSASFSFSNTGAFPEGDYSMVFGTFDEESLKPITSKMVRKPSYEGEVVKVELDKLPKNAKSLRLALITSKGGTVSYTLFDNPLVALPSADVVIAPREINLVRYERIQTQVFTKCAQCHGGAGFAGAGLYLTDGNSYANLFEIQSNKSAKLRVKQYDPAGSFIMDILKERELTEAHSSIFTTLVDDDVALVEEWIKKGAEKIE